MKRDYKKLAFKVIKILFLLIILFLAIMTRPPRFQKRSNYGMTVHDLYAEQERQKYLNSD